MSSEAISRLAPWLLGAEIAPAKDPSKTCYKHSYSLSSFGIQEVPISEMISLASLLASWFAVSEGKSDGDIFMTTFKTTL